MLELGGGESCLFPSLGKGQELSLAREAGNNVTAETCKEEIGFIFKIYVWVANILWNTRLATHSLHLNYEGRVFGFRQRPLPSSPSLLPATDGLVSSAPG